MNPERRRFLAATGYGIGATALTTLIDQMTLTSALATTTSGYKALVCIFLGGGNDSNNTVIPLGGTGDPTGGFNAYFNVRNPQGLAYTQAQLANTVINPASFAFPFALHPSLPDLQNLFNNGHLAVVTNVGPLVAPLDRSSYQGNGPKPFQLFSHSDQIQQWQTAVASTRSGTGWGGRVADQLPVPAIPMVTSVSGAPVFSIGQSTRPLGIAPAPTSLNRVLFLNGYGTTAQEVARQQAYNNLLGVQQGNTLVSAATGVINEAQGVAQIFNVPDPTFTTVFPNTSLGNQLLQVARIIKLNQQNSFSLASNQIFFCQLGGFDTHQQQQNTQPGLLTQVNNAMIAFYNATVELGLSSSVTTFTHADFNRTFQPAGNGASVGTDHAWGSHHFVMGDAVVGGDFYGVPLAASSGGNGTVYPTLQLNGPYDTDVRGRWIPTTAVEQYAATLALWYGLPATSIAAVFPALDPNNPIFTPTNLGFLG